MPENRPFLITTERTSLLPLLIIDKSGVLGIALAQQLHKQFLVVLVTPTIPEELASKRNIIHIPYKKKIPLIPDNIYSHVFLFFNGEKELLDMLPSFMKKANESAGKLFFVTSIFYSSPFLFKRLSLHSLHHMKIVLFGEIFDNDLQEENLVNFFIYQARLHGRIEVPSNGNGRLYPVHLEDVLSAIIALAFAQARTNRVLLVFPKHEISEMSVARIIQKIHPYLKVDYRKYKKRQPVFYLPQDGAYCFPDYHLEARLRDIDFSQQQPRRERVQIRRALQKRKKTTASPLVYAGILVIYVFILPISLVGMFSVLGISSLSLAVKEAESANLATAKNYAAFSHFSFSSASNLSETLVYLDYIAKQQKTDAVKQLNNGKQMAETVGDLVEAATSLQNIINGKSTQPKNDFMQSLATVKNSLLVLQKMKAEQSLPAHVIEKVRTLDALIELLENTGDTYPNILGFEGKKKYLVLFQNNMELRPGGGFIGSYGLVTVENGKADKLQINDVYDADGKLTTHVEPPYGIRRYLGATHWFLRDSNFDPDFTKNAQIAANFLQLETTESVDGVIAVDTEFLHKLLQALGPIHVMDYNETVTADNFYLLTQTHAEKDFFPGSSQKKDFLRSLFNAMMLHLQEQKHVAYPVLVNALMESIRGKHLMVAFSDKGVQEVYTVNNLSGAMWDARTSAGESVLDYLGVIDANIGANKANYYLNRSIEQKVVLGDTGTVQETVTVTYENTSKKDSPFGGDYKNYVRFLLPLNAQVTAVLFDNNAVKTTPAVTDPAVFAKKDFLPPVELEVEQSDNNGKHVIGFIHQVPAGTKKTVTITYTIPNAFETKVPLLRYHLRLFKQPGTAMDPYALQVAYPSTYSFQASGQEGTDVGGKINYQTNLNEDKNVVLQFAKK